ncbi:peptidase M23 [Streptomyces sp. TRM76323]|uniref:Peptidase M23 n=1 Tax=Streptomyces tamarix TaxID=3078565 RepID=A0ABU3QSV7_9ACTN|nr:peptidase M23 [Streptomyces tamarix]MDT9685603.1 peptidase M23 [Streptomyces tamarix]
MNSRQAAMLATGVARRGAALKLAVPASLLFFAFLIGLGIVGGISGSSQASAASCGGAGLPDAQYENDDESDEGGTDSTDGLHAQQIDNAKTIDRVAATGGLSGRATLIALMTALQESTLINLDHGPGDSVGLFQQKPQYGWGTKEQIMKPEYAAKMFFFGADSGSPRGLTDVKGWESMALEDAAEAVQASEQGELYAGQESEARRIAKEAGINLTHPGKAKPTDTPSDDTPDDASDAPSDAPTERCETEEDRPDTPAKPGTAFHDGDANWPAQVKNPRSTADAVKWAQREADSGSLEWYQWCLKFVAQSYGWTSAGSRYAIDHYWAMPSTMRHNRDRNPPVGALMFWSTDGRAGHVALYVGKGQIASNDIREPGRISIVPATDIESKWGATYQGWAPPYFPNAG